MEKWGEKKRPNSPAELTQVERTPQTSNFRASVVRLSAPPNLPLTSAPPPLHFAVRCLRGGVVAWG